MRWPPNQTWTSVEKREGYRHFEVKTYGGKGKDRWVELSPLLNKTIKIKISFSELKSQTAWTSGWLQIAEEENLIA